MIVDRRLGYPVVVGFDLCRDIAAALLRRGAPVFVLCDANATVAAGARAIARAARATALVPIALGERRKRAATLERVWGALAAAGAGRDAVAVGVGGGVASDLFGFAAATYARGIPYVHVATSLVAMADAAIGGKTGINIQAGKNLAGLFADPIGVYADVRALRTLPYHRIREGLAEIVKTSVIEGGTFFGLMERLVPQPFARWPWEEVIARAIRVKTKIVARDRTEKGERELLNLGHTFAHGIERASGYRIAHGAAVALGLRAAVLLASRLGRLSDGSRLRVERMLAGLRMPVRTSVESHAIFDAMEYDKKRRGGMLRFVVPNEIGDVSYGVNVPRVEVMHVLARLTEG